MSPLLAHFLCFTYFPDWNISFYCRKYTSMWPSPPIYNLTHAYIHACIHIIYTRARISSVMCQGVQVLVDVRWHPFWHGLYVLEIPWLFAKSVGVNGVLTCMVYRVFTLIVGSKEFGCICYSSCVNLAAQSKLQLSSSCVWCVLVIICLPALEPSSFYALFSFLHRSCHQRQRNCSTTSESWLVRMGRCQLNSWGRANWHLPLRLFCLL